MPASTASARPRHAPEVAGTADPNPLRGLHAALDHGMGNVGTDSGALVVDLTTGRTLYSNAAGVPRLPASVEKLYTATAVLDRFGPAAILHTDVLSDGQTDDSGSWHGTLYLRGGGDPTFGTAAFDRANYGTGATVGALADSLVSATGMRAFHDRVIGDESMLDSLRGTPPYGYAFSAEIEGSLSALTFNRDVNADWTAPVEHPAASAAAQLIGALRARGVDVSGASPGAGRTPATARLLASADSPSIAKLIALTLAPSDNFFAEMLLKDLGARFGGAGTTFAGAAVVRSQLSAWGLHPQLEDGSGLSRRDHTSPAQVVSLLERFARYAPLHEALAVAGRTGTLRRRMRRTAAQDNCRGKTGTLHDVSALAGYCLARDGHTLVFALLMNGVDPYYARDTQDGMVEAIARYRG